MAVVEKLGNGGSDMTIKEKETRTCCVQERVQNRHPGQTEIMVFRVP